MDIGFGWDSWHYTFAAQPCFMRQCLLALMFLPLIGWGQETLVVEDYQPDHNADGCYTVHDLTELLCYFGTCGMEDPDAAPDFQPYAQADSCYSAFDLLPFLGLYGTCEEDE